LKKYTALCKQKKLLRDSTLSISEYLIEAYVTDEAAA
jgi:hypothetical protein